MNESTGQVSTNPFQRGDIVQVRPSAAGIRPEFRGQLVIVDEPKSFGLQGYVLAMDGKQGMYFVRLTFDQVYETGGRATWMASDYA